MRFLQNFVVCQNLKFCLNCIKWTRKFSNTNIGRRRYWRSTIILLLLSKSSHPLPIWVLATRCNGHYVHKVLAFYAAQTWTSSLTVVHNRPERITYRLGFVWSYANGVPCSVWVAAEGAPGKYKLLKVIHDTITTLLKSFRIVAKYVDGVWWALSKREAILLHTSWVFINTNGTKRLKMNRNTAIRHWNLSFGVLEALSSMYP